MKNIKRYRMKNYRIFVEKHPRFRVEAESLRRELNANLNLDIRELRLLNVYDLFGFSEELLEKTRYSVFGEVVTDSVTDACDLAGQKYIAVEYLPAVRPARRVGRGLRAADRPVGRGAHPFVEAVAVRRRGDRRGDRADQTLLYQCRRVARKGPERAQRYGAGRG